MNLLNFSDFKVGARKHHSDTDRGETKRSPYMLQTQVFDNPSSKTKEEQNGTIKQQRDNIRTAQNSQNKRI